MSLGFQLRKLQIRGNSVPIAEIRFTPGFNVITGPSDTGKSYLYQCINYMLGGDSPPKPIDESNGYSIIWLEIITSENQAFTLIRGIRGGGINLFKGRIEELDSDISANIISLKNKHDANDSDNISTFLLSLFGIEQNIKVRKNKNLETINLTFRTIYQLFLVDEERIIEEKSPVYGSTAYSANTVSKWAFHFLLTGENDNDLIPLPDPKITAVQNKTRLLVFEELISELEEKIKQLRENSQVSNVHIDELENRISEQANAVSVSSGAIAQQQQERQTLWNLQQEADSRIIAIDELLLRFSLLKTHYETDLERLDFMSEGDFYFQQLETVNCPLCGTALEEHEARQRCVEKNGELIDLQTAARTESEKISLHLRDLEQTFGTLESERNLLSENSNKYRIEIEEIDRLLREALRPQLVAEKAILDQLLQERRILDALEINSKRLQELWVSRANINNRQNLVGQEQEVNVNLDGVSLSKLD